ncbi:MAG: AMP-binding protein [Acidobacteria bacterium]|nr:AMP-binding protein [Acidobacteriota bacterium]
MNYRRYTTGPYPEMCHQFRWEVPENYNIAWDVCEKHDPNRTAMIWENHDGQVRVLSFQDFSRLSNRVAHLLEGLGVRKGDRVVVLLPRLPEAVAIFLGVYKAGAILISLSSLYGKDGVRHRVLDSGPKVIFTNQENLEKFDGLHQEVEELQKGVIVDLPRSSGNWLSFSELLEQASDRQVDVRTTSQDPAQIYYSSGTTGQAKGILHAHRYLLAHNELEFCHDIRGDELFWSTGEWAWIAGIIPGFLGPWKYGATVLAYNSPGKFDPEKAFYLLNKYPVKNLFATPTALRMMMQVPDPGRYPVHLRVACSAGEPLNPEVIRWSREVWEIPIFDFYGLTESYPLCGNFPSMEVKPGSMGRPLPGWEVALLGPDEQPVQPGAVGEICLKARSNPHYPLGYWKRPADTQEVFGGPWFHTRDLANQDEEGYVWFQGRADDVIISAGYRIGPFEVESALIEHPAVAEAAAVASPDPERGHIVKAYVVLTKEARPSDDLVKELQEHVRKSLAAYAYPRSIEFVQELPKTETGKIRRAVLRQQAAS